MPCMSCLYFCLICLMLIIHNTGFSYDIFIHVHNIFRSHSPSIALLSLFYSSLSPHLALLLLCVYKKDLVNVTKTVYRNMGALPVSVLLKKKSFPLPSAANCISYRKGRMSLSHSVTGCREASVNVGVYM